MSEIKICSNCFREIDEIGYIDEFNRLICSKCKGEFPYTYQQFCERCRKYIRKDINAIDVPLFYLIIYEFSARRICKDRNRLKGLNYCEKCYNQYIEKFKVTDKTARVDLKFKLFQNEE